MNTQIKSILLVFVLSLLLAFAVTGCNDESQELGIGPVKKVELSPNIDAALSETGKSIFDNKCVACHKLDDKLVGPPLHGVTKKRKPEWIMNMILNPEQMTKENLEAKKLFGQYLTQMTFQNVTEQDARAILEYLRSVDSK